MEALSSSRSLFWFLRRGLLDVEASPCFYLHPTLTSLRAEGREFMAAPQRARGAAKNNTWIHLLKLFNWSVVSVGLWGAKCMVKVHAPRRRRHVTPHGVTLHGFPGTSWLLVTSSKWSSVVGIHQLCYCSIPPLPPHPFSNTLVGLTFYYGKVQDDYGQSYVRISYLLIFGLPNQVLHSLRVCHCSRLKVWYSHIAELLRVCPFSCGLEIPPKLFKTAAGHLQTFQCPFLFICT